MNTYNYTKKLFLNESKSTRNSFLNEVRLPNGLFVITNAFMMMDENPSSNWDIVFPKGQILYLDTQNKELTYWSTNNNTWEPKEGLSYKGLMLPERYAKFKTNTKKITVNELPKGVNSPDNISSNSNTFTTTVKAFNRKADQEGLEPEDKITVTTTD